MNIKTRGASRLPCASIKFQPPGNFKIADAHFHLSEARVRETPIDQGYSSITMFKMETKTSVDKKRQVRKNYTNRKLGSMHIIH
jgi:hypothetical protein